MEKSMNHKYTDDDLNEIFTLKASVSTYNSYFIENYKQIHLDLFEEAEGDVSFMEEEDGKDFRDIVLDITIQFYLDPFVAEIKIGHSEMWASIIAKYSCDFNSAFGHAYSALSKIDPVIAKKELLIYCKSIGADELFTDCFCSNIYWGESFDNSKKSANRYCRSYNDHIKTGKSIFFAKQYAEYELLTGYNNVTCYVYADTYEKALDEGKTDEYAIEFAKIYSDYIGDNYGNIKYYLNEDESLDFYYQKSLTDINIWELNKRSK